MASAAWLECTVPRAAFYYVRQRSSEDSLTAERIVLVLWVHHAVADDLANFLIVVEADYFARQRPRLTIDSMLHFHACLDPFLLLTDGHLEHFHEVVFPPLFVLVVFQVMLALQRRLIAIVSMFSVHSLAGSCNCLLMPQDKVLQLALYAAPAIFALMHIDAWYEASLLSSLFGLDHVLDFGQICHFVCDRLADLTLIVIAADVVGAEATPLCDLLVRQHRVVIVTVRDLLLSLALDALAGRQFSADLRQCHFVEVDE